MESSSHLDLEWLLSTLFDASLLKTQSRILAALFFAQTARYLLQPTNESRTLAFGMRVAM